MAAPIKVAPGSVLINHSMPPSAPGLALVPLLFAIAFVSLLEGTGAVQVRAASARASRHCGRHLWTSLETCVQPFGDNTTYVTTGDIPAMWIRDSAAQMSPYVIVAEAEGPTSRLWRLLEGTLRRQAQFILTDPYANAFQADWDLKLDRRLNRGGYVFTGNYEMDSGPYFFRFLDQVRRASPAAAVVREDPVHRAVQMLVKLYRMERHHFEESPYRYPQEPPWELPGEDGRGHPVAYTGMVWGAFRPSDDPQKYGYHVPSNIFLASTLKSVADMARDHWEDPALEADALELRETILEGVRRHGIGWLPGGEAVYCYEVDGFGNCSLMDDANIPSLLSLPYLDPKAETFDMETYRSTRRFVLSAANPYFYKGTYGEGIGSPHMDLHDHIWPLSLVMQAMTADTQDEADDIIARLLSHDEFVTDGLPESFHKDDVSRISRRWFGWPNSLLGELQLSRKQCGGSSEQARIPAESPAPRTGPLSTLLQTSTFYSVGAELLRRDGVTLPS